MQSFNTFFCSFKDRTGKNSTVGGSRVVSPLILDPVLSGAGPTSARSALRNDVRIENFDD